MDTEVKIKLQVIGEPNAKMDYETKHVRKWHDAMWAKYEIRENVLFFLAHGQF